MTNWSTKKLGEVCEIIAGQAPPSRFYNHCGEGKPFLRVNSFGEIYPNIDSWTTKCLKECKKGDILFSVAGSLGFVNLGIDACITRSIFALRPLKKIITQKFLFYFLRKLIKSKNCARKPKNKPLKFFNRHYKGFLVKQRKNIPKKKLKISQW